MHVMLQSEDYESKEVKKRKTCGWLK